MCVRILKKFLAHGLNTALDLISESSSSAFANLFWLLHVNRAGVPTCFYCSHWSSSRKIISQTYNQRQENNHSCFEAVVDQEKIIERVNWTKLRPLPSHGRFAPILKHGTLSNFTVNQNIFYQGILKTQIIYTHSYEI